MEDGMVNVYLVDNTKPWEKLLADLENFKLPRKDYHFIGSSFSDPKLAPPKSATDTDDLIDEVLRNIYASHMFALPCESEQTYRNPQAPQ